ncbi:hypothetical protein [Flavobacterium microcysteis]
MRKALYILILLFFTSCNQEKKNIFSEVEIKELTKSIPGTNIFTNTDIMFVKLENEKVGFTNIRHLSRIFQSKYKETYKNFDNFLFQALNQKISFSSNYFVEHNVSVFSISKNIEKQYLTSGLSFLREKYFEKRQKNFVLKNKNLTSHDIYSVLYYFYINGYITTFDDAIGIYEVWN